MMGNEALDNVYSMVYLGAEIAGDGDQKVTLKHRCDIAWGRFAYHRRALTSTKLPISLKPGYMLYLSYLQWFTEPMLGCSPKRSENR